MIASGQGALLFTTELSAMILSSMFGNSGIAMSGLRNYILNLHDGLLPLGVIVGHLSISPLIKKDTAYRTHGWVGMIWMPAQTNGLNQLPPVLYPHGTAVMNTLQQVVGAIGTAVAISILSSGMEK